MKVPSVLKGKFNKLNFPLFINHPIDDPDIHGCVVKYQQIKWKEFAEFLVEKKLLNIRELEMLRDNGWTATNRE